MKKKKINLINIETIEQKFAVRLLTSKGETLAGGVKGKITSHHPVICDPRPLHTELKLLSGISMPFEIPYYLVENSKKNQASFICYIWL